MRRLRIRWPEGGLFCAAAIAFDASNNSAVISSAPPLAYDNSVAGVKQYPANSPIEDRCHMSRLSHGEWFFSVFDGHGGWQCAHYASRKLYENVEFELNNHLGHHNINDDGSYEGHIDRKVVAKALKSAFERTDRQYMTKVAGAFELGFGLNTRAGSCALGALVVDGNLFVANAGDSRAVLAVSRASTSSDRKPNFSSRRPSIRGGGAGAEADNDLLLSMDDLMGQAAVKDSIGEEVDPKLAEALRARLLSQIYLLRQAENKGDVPKSEKPTIPKPNNSSFVNVVRMLTGGGVEDSPPEITRCVAIEMSHDHNCREPRERAALEKMHPDEKDVVICRADNPDQCYIKGKLQPTRAFGDFYLKYSEFMRGANEDPAAGRYVPPPYTPPYITATPEVQIRTLQPGVDEFLILATDGLWDMMSSQDAVDIVSAYLLEPGANVADAGDALIEEALHRAAKNAGMSVAQMKALKAGRSRRSKHDDISVVVIDLSRLMELDYWG